MKSGDGRTDNMYENMITTSRDGGSAEWINIFNLLRQPDDAGKPGGGPSDPANPNHVANDPPTFCPPWDRGPSSRWS